MKKEVSIALFLILVNFLLMVILPGVPVSGQGQGTTGGLRRVLSLPATCDPNQGQIVFVLFQGPQVCTATNTWVPLLINGQDATLHSLNGVYNGGSFAGATADAQMAAAMAYACANGGNGVTMYGLVNTTISSTVSLGCSDGTPLDLYFAGAVKFVPSSTSTNMFTPLPGVRAHGAISAAPITSYAGNVMQLAGRAYDNQPGNLTASKGTTSIEELDVYGGALSTGTALYLSGTSSSEYIEFTGPIKVVVSGMLYGVHGVSSNFGWINSNEINVRCASTVHCMTLETSDANGNIVGNKLVVDAEYLTTFTTRTLDGLYFKGSGEEADNDAVVRFWDWGSSGGCSNGGPYSYPTCATVRVDTGLAHNFGNTVNGMGFATQMVDSGTTLSGYDSIDTEYFGDVVNPTGEAAYHDFDAVTYGSGFSLGGHNVLTSDNGANSILDPMTASGNVFLRSGVAGVYKASLNSTGTFSVFGTQTTQSLINPFSSTITTGAMFNAYHDTSTFNGYGLYMDFAHGSGSFTGYFINGLINSVTKFSVDSSGNVIATGGASFATVKIGGTLFAPVVEAQSANHAVCVKAAGPPVQIGYCSTVVASDGSCTCN